MISANKKPYQVGTAMIICPICGTAVEVPVNIEGFTNDFDEFLNVHFQQEPLLHDCGGRSY